MAASKSPLIRLLQIIDKAEAIDAAIQGFLFEEFRESWVLNRVVEHGLLTISEAAKTLPVEIKEAAPGIAWPKIETLGNFVRYEYRDVDPELVWSITQEDLPELVKAARKLAALLRDPVPA